jgi:hypothetical protein
LSVTVIDPVAGPYTPNSVTTAFGFDFKAGSVGEVQVVQILNGALSVISDALYDVALDSDEGGAVNFTAAPLTGTGSIYIVSTPDFTRTGDFSGHTPFNPASVNGEFDRALIRDIALQGQLDRTALVPVGETMGPLPPKATRAGLSFGFDAGGNPIAVNPGGADSALRTDLAAPSGIGLVGSTLGRAHSLATTALTKLNRFISASADYGILGNDSDDTTKLQNLFADLQSGDIVVFPAGSSRLTAKLTLGNGSAATRSTINGVTFIFPPGGHPQAFIAATSIPKSGYHIDWYGAAGGMMLEWAGPINGIQVIGALQLDGRNVAGYGLQAFSFSHSMADHIAVYNCTVENIRLDTRDATSIGGDINGITSADNSFPLISSFTPANAGAIALVIDGYELAGGQDFTGNRIGTVRLGQHGAGKGLWLGFSDFNRIEMLICIFYSPISGAGSPLYLDGSALPFDTPTTMTIGWFATTAGQPTGSTNGQVVIENYSLDDIGGSPVPTDVQGLHIHSFDTFGTVSPTRVKPVTLSALTTAFGNGRAGERHMVSDATVAGSGNFGAIVAGGGANKVPVYSDGTNWRIG